MVDLSGGCLCGAVRYQGQSEQVLTAQCYCVDCRKSSGIGHCSHMGASKDGVTVSGEVRLYERPADSGNVVARAFCPVCGSAVYSLNSAMPEFIFLRASSLDDPELFQPQMSVYTARAPSWEVVNSDLPSFPLMPPMAGR